MVLPTGVHEIDANNPWQKLETYIMTELVDRPIISQDKAKGIPDQTIASFRPILLEIQPLANEPITVAIRKSVAILYKRNIVIINKYKIIIRTYEPMQQL